MRARFLPRCRVTGKVSYRTHTKALLALVEVVFDLDEQKPDRSKVPCRTYQCEFCSYWHLTAQPLRDTANRVDSSQVSEDTSFTDRNYAHGTHR